MSVVSVTPVRVSALAAAYCITSSSLMGLFGRGMLAGWLFERMQTTVYICTFSDMDEVQVQIGTATSR